MILVHIRTVPGLNAREHWRARAKRVKAEREATRYAIARKDVPIPCTVRLTRIAPSAGVDDDNLAGALKAVRDEVAACLGIDDRHTGLVRYVYAQQRGPWGVGIEFGEMTQPAAFTAMEVA